MEEIWKDINSHKGLYQVSNLGRIKSLKRLVRSRFKTKTVPEKILKAIKSKTGYYVVNFTTPKRKQYLIHRIVAEHFLPISANQTHVNHKNFDKSNNSVSNLEWVNPKQNIDHSCIGGRNGRLILNLQTGVFYYTIIDASNSIGISETMLLRRLQGRIKNDTHFIYA